MKNFLIKLSYTVLPVWIAVVVGVAVFSLVLTPAMTGDIGRLALLPFGKEYDDTLEKGEKMPKMIYTTTSSMHDLKNVSCDVLTVGDSFSDRYQNGYQNYLAANGVKVVNCARTMYYNPVTFAYELLDWNIIDSTNTNVMVVEIVERSFEYFMEEFDPKPQLVSVPTEGKKLRQSDVNQWSLSRLRDFVLLRTGYASVPVTRVELDGEYFSGDDPSTLYFFNDDLYIKGIVEKDKVMQTWRTLLDKADEKHISLILVVAVDKFDLYQDHIVNNPYSRNQVNEDIAELFGNDTHILLTKNCLKPLIECGEKDIFLFNDTHWSYKAAEVVGNELYKMLP